MTKDTENPLRTRVRVKAASQNVSLVVAANAQRALGAEPMARPRSLLEALKQSVPQSAPSLLDAKPSAAAPVEGTTTEPKKRKKKKSAAGKVSSTKPKADTARRDAEPAKAAVVAAPVQGPVPELTTPGTPERASAPVATATPITATPRDVLTPRMSPAHQAAARLKRLERLKQATAGLESLTRGEIEEATVEIIHYDGRGNQIPFQTKR